LDENQDFKVVGVGDPQRAQTDVSSWARTEMELAVTIDLTIDEIDGGPAMAIEVEEVPNELKPCYYKPKGLRGSGGAYLRSGGTDRPMTDYEIFGYISSRGQPKQDEEAVDGVALHDLDSTLLDRYLGQLRSSRNLAGYLDGPRDEVLTRLHICVRHGNDQRPTLAGLLMFGKYPQEIFPQLMITFVHISALPKKSVRLPAGGLSTTSVSKDQSLK
jgi:ATP-dependent DNA helicase RecG